MTAGYEREGYAPQFDDGTGIPVETARTYPTPEEAVQAGRELQAAGLPCIGYTRRVLRADLVTLAHELRGAPATTPEKRRRAGVVTRWAAGENYGFVTEDDTGRGWFLSAGELSGGRGMLPVGTPVTFAGNQNPPPGKKHPSAWSVRVEVPDTPPQRPGG